MPRAKRPNPQVFTWTGFWLVVGLVFLAAFVAALIWLVLSHARGG